MALPRDFACPVCAGRRLGEVATATGSIAYCHACFQGVRPAAPSYAYAANAMCGLGTAPERLGSQCRFVAPYVAAGAAVLEIGCATGELAEVLQRELPIARYEAIELSAVGQVAASRVSRLHGAYLRQLLADEVLAPGQFDLVVMSHVLEHVEEIGAEVAAMAAVLKPGGALFIEVPLASGNVALPVDDNVSHLHFFSVGSLTRLLAGAGLDVVALEMGARLDARYADSLRVVARGFALPELSALDLSAHPLLAGRRVVVWGAGSLASELLANFLPPERIAYFVDRDPAKQGGLCLGREVRAPEALAGEAGLVILINSIDFAPRIEQDIARLLPGHGHELVRIGDVIEHFRGARLAGG